MRKRVNKATLVVFFVGTLFGIIFWGGFHTVVEETNSMAFCTSCHEMTPVYEEYKASVHYKMRLVCVRSVPIVTCPRNGGQRWCVRYRRLMSFIIK